MENIEQKNQIMSKTLSSQTMNRTSTVMHQALNIYFGENNSDKKKGNARYPDNTISTTKYNLLTFLPKSLLFQFFRAANIYFLITSVLTCFYFSPKQPSSMIGTFAFVLFATMVKEAFEDYGRYKLDQVANNRLVYKYLKGDWAKVKCASLRPGDFVNLKKDEEFSADTLVIKTSNENGVCYKDTKSLDGETNLKECQPVAEFRDSTIGTLLEITGHVNCEGPNENLERWDGTILCGGKSISVNANNIILKGCTLKNTDDIYGIIIYTGHNNKIMKHAKSPRRKVSKVMLTMNKLLYSLFIVVIFICIVFGSINFGFVKGSANKYAYLFPDYQQTLYATSGAAQWGINVVVYFIAYSGIIPISLYVALEVVKMIQGILIYYDHEIYDSDLKKPAICKTTDLIEELGQIEFIFSDKTGTLTQNSMILKKCFVDGNIYGQKSTVKEDADETINGDYSMRDVLSNTSKIKEKSRKKLEDFLYHLSACHTILPERGDHGNINYQGSSQDEIALVHGASKLGISFVQKKDLNKEGKFYTVSNKYSNKQQDFKILSVIPFSSDRKRMTVIVQNEDGQITVLTKGADNVMIDKISINKEFKDPCITHFDHTSEKLEVSQVLEMFSKEGLRILVMGQKNITMNEFKEWDLKYSKPRLRDPLKSKLEEEMECNLTYVGCSAIEDKLQEGVPDTINTLLNCGIRVWVLTGDKSDTAKEIAKSCRLIDENMELMEIYGNDVSEVENHLRDYAQRLNIDNFEDENKNIDLERIAKLIKNQEDYDIGIVVEGDALNMIFQSEELEKMFFLITLAAKSVLCCRVRPNEKAKVVQMIKKHGKWITLSIGDGANDVPMIMEAHIGVGIIGKEGDGAVRSADYAIGKFRFLEKLVLVYGRNGYIKITKFICYYFYKNIVLVFTELFFAFFNGFSGQIYFADYLSTMFNAFFTSWPCVFTFSLEREHNLTTCKKFPTLYLAGKYNFYFNFVTFWKYIIYAIIHSALAFCIPAVGLYDQVGGEGSTFNHWRISTVSFCVVIHVVTFKLILISEFWNAVNIISSIFSIAFYYIVLLVLCSDSFAKSFQIELLGVGPEVLTNFKALLVIVLTPLICLLPDIIFKQINFSLYPNPSELLDKFIDTPDVKKVLMGVGSNLSSADVKGNKSLESKAKKRMTTLKTIQQNHESKMPFYESPVVLIKKDDKIERFDDRSVHSPRKSINSNSKSRSNRYSDIDDLNNKKSENNLNNPHEINQGY